MTQPQPPLANPPEVRINVDRTSRYYGRVAIKTGPAVTAGAWFIIEQNSGGHYSNGEREGVDTPSWVTLPTPADLPAASPEPETPPEAVIA